MADTTYESIHIEAVVREPVTEPTLTLSTETPYDGTRGVASTGPYPERGVADKDTFTFKVVYTDVENVAPESLTVNLETNAVIETTEIPMAVDTAATDPALYDGDYTNGEQYVATGGPYRKAQFAFSFTGTTGDSTTLSLVDPSLTFQTGYSNVAFLPGFQASRLSRPLDATDTQRLWEPVLGGEELDLVMNEQGIPDHTDIFVTEIIDEGAFRWLGPNIYKSFIAFMNDLTDPSDPLIHEWQALPYDWRYDLEDVVNNPIALTNSTYSLRAEIERLAESSDSGEVTIIGHSNGGLVGKQLITTLAQQDKADLVDQFIMVATPQLGTPKAIASLLHGTEQAVPKSLGLLLSEKNARTIGRNLPGAYNLLPSTQYLATVEDPVVTFEQNDSTYSKTKLFTDAYGTTIDTPTELFDFLTGVEGRAEPQPYETEKPIRLNGTMLSKALQNHQALDTWTPPAGVEVSQIAGWGLDTIRTVHYRNKCLLSDPGCTLDLYLDRDSLTSEGDETVVYPSAVGMEGVQQYYFNLKASDTFSRLNRKHADILEPDSVLELINRLIVRQTDELPEYITTEKPNENTLGKRMRLRGLSPIALGITDSEGRYTGLVDNPDPSSDIRLVQEEIPNSYYWEFGEGKYLGLDTEDMYDVSIQGTDTGMFTIELDEVEGDTVTRTLAWSDVPVTTTLTGSINLDPTQGELAPVLELDHDGDGIIDQELEPTIEGEEPTDPLVVLAELKSYVSSLHIHKFVKRYFLYQVKKTEWYIKKDRTKQALRTVKLVKFVTEWYAKWRVFSEEEKEVILEHLGDVEKLLRGNN